MCSLPEGGGEIKGTADQTSSCQHPLSKRLVWDIYKRVGIEIKRDNKTWVLVLVRVIKSLVLAH